MPVAQNQELLQFLMAVSAEGMKPGLKQGGGLVKEFVDSTTKNLSQVDQSLQKTGNNISTFATTTGTQLAKAAGAFDDIHKSASDGTVKTVMAFDKMGKAIEQKLLEHGQRLKSSAAATKIYNEQISAEYKQIAATMTEAAAANRKYASSVDSITKSSSTAPSSLPPATQPTAPAAPASGSGGLAGRAAAGRGSAFDGMGEQAKSTAASIQAVEDRFSSLETTSRRAVTAATGALGGIAIIAGGSLKVFGDYEATMNRFKSVAEATDQELAKLDLTAKQLGASTQFSSRAVGQAAVELAKMGFTTAQTIQMLPGVVKTAAAGQIELAEAANLVAAAMRGFQQEGLTSVKVGDLMARAAASSAIDFRDLGETYSYVSGIASASNQSIEDTTALIAIMGNNMIKGSMAGTSLRSAFTRLQNPTEKARDALKLLNVEIADTATGQMRSLPEILKDMQKGFVGVDETTRNAAISTIFGQEALSGLVAVLNQSPDAIDAMVSKMHNVDGAADQMAKESFKGLNAELETLKSSLETAAIGMGEQLSPMVIDGIQSIRGLIESYDQLPDSMKSGIAQMLAMAAQGAALTLALGGTTKAVTFLTNTIIGFVGAERISMGIMAAKKAALAITTTATLTYNAAIVTGSGNLANFARATTAAAGALTNGMAAGLRATLPFLGKLVIALAAVHAIYEKITAEIRAAKAEEEALDAADETRKIQSSTSGSVANAIERVKNAKPNQKLRDLFTSQEMGDVAHEAQMLANKATDPAEKEKYNAIAASYRRARDEIKGAKDQVDKLTKAQQDFIDLQQKADAAQTETDKRLFQGELKKAKVRLDAELKAAQANKNIRKEDIAILTSRNADLNKKLMDAVTKGDTDEERAAEQANKLADERLDKLRQEVEGVKRVHEARAQAIEAEFKSAQQVGALGSSSMAANQEAIKSADNMIKAFDGIEKSVGFCLYGVKQLYAASKGLSTSQFQTGVLAGVGHAADAADKLAQDTRLIEVHLDRTKSLASQLKKGDIAVFNRRAGFSAKYGHIEVADPERKRMLSDHARDMSFSPQMEANVRVFRMKGMQVDDSTIKMAQKLSANATEYLNKLLQIEARLKSQGASAKELEFIDDEIAKARKAAGDKAIDIIEARKKAEAEALKEQAQIFMQYVKTIEDGYDKLIDKVKDYNDNLAKSHEEYLRERDMPKDPIARQELLSAEAIGKTDELIKKGNAESLNLARQMEALKAANPGVKLDVSQQNQLNGLKAKQLKIEEELNRLVVVRREQEDIENDKMERLLVERDAKQREEDNKAAAQREMRRREEEKAQNEENISVIRKRQGSIGNIKKIQGLSFAQSLAADPNQSMVKTDAQLRAELQNKADLLKAEMGRIPMQGLSQAESEEKMNKLAKERAAILFEIDLLGDRQVKSLDRQIDKAGKVGTAWQDVAGTLDGISQGLNAVSNLSDIFGGGSKGAKEFSTITKSASGITSSISGIVKDMAEGKKDITQIAIEHGTKILSSLGDLGGLFPSGEEVRRAKADFQNTLIEADQEIAAARLELRKRQGQIDDDEYYKMQIAQERARLQQTQSRITEEANRQKQDMVGMFDIVSLVFTGKLTEGTGSAMGQVLAKQNAEIEKAAFESAAKIADIQREAEDKRRQSLSEAAATDAQTRVDQAKRLGNVLAQVEAEYQQKMLAIIQEAEEKRRAKDRGEISGEQYAAAIRSAEEKGRQAQADRVQQYQASNSMIRQLDFENTAFQIKGVQDGLKRRKHEIDLAADQELADVHDKMRVMERMNNTNTDEYKALQQKEVNIKQDANQKKLDEEREYTSDVTNLHRQLSASLAALTGDDIDDIKASRAQRIAEAAKAVDEQLKQFPEQSEVIIKNYKATLQKIMADSNNTMMESRKKRNDDTRALLQLEAEATMDLMDDVEVAYSNSLSEINDREQMALNNTLLSEQEKAQASRRAVAERLKAEKNYYDNVRSMALEQLAQAKKLREEMFDADTFDMRQNIAANERLLAEVDIKIRTQQMTLNAIKAKYDRERLGLKDKDLNMFTSAMTGIDIEKQTREALKFNQVNITGAETEAAALKTRTDAIDAYTAHLEEKAQNDRILKKIDEQQLQKELQNAALIRARFAQDQMGTVEQQYDKQIKAQEDAGMSAQEVDILRGKKMKELENLRSKYAESFKRYKELELASLDAAQAKEGEAAQQVIDNENIKKVAIENNIEAQKLKIDELQIKYNADMALIDQAVNKVTQSHRNLAVSVDDLRNNLGGTLDGIISKYNALSSAAANVKLPSLPTVVGGSSSGGSSDGSGGLASSGTTAVANIPKSKDPSPDFPVQYGDYYYKNTTDAYRANGLATGAVIADWPWMRGDRAGLFNLDAGERVLSRRDNNDLMGHVLRLSEMVGRSLQSSYTNSMSQSIQNQITLSPVVRSDADLKQLVNFVTGIITGKELNGSKTYGYVTR